MTAYSFSRLALVFVILYLTLISGVLFPFQPHSPFWQSQLMGTLINGATLPLMALVLLQIGTRLYPRDLLLKRRQKRFNQLAVAAALGFLLLIPFQIASGVLQQSNNTAQASKRLAASQDKLVDLQLAVSEASSNADLAARFAKLKGPPLSPADLTLPLPVLKAQVNAAFAQAQSQINRERSAVEATSATGLLPEQFRHAVACLAIASGFAVFGREPGPTSLIQE